MSWMRLLAVGKSIIGIRNERSPYKMTQDNLLPKFGRKPGGEAEVSTAGETVTAVDIRVGGAAKDAVALSGAPAPRAGAAVLAADATAVTGLLPSDSAAACSSRRGGRWRSRLTGPAGPGPMQEELRLETVKVMRNDLRDADLEVVPSRQVCPLGSLQRAVAIGTDPEPVGGWRSKLTSRLFGGGRT